MSDEPINGGTLPYRMGQAEREIARLWKEAARARDVEKLFGAVEQKASMRDIDALKEIVTTNTAKTESLRKTIMGFAFTVAAAGVSITAAVLVSAGHS